MGPAKSKKAPPSGREVMTAQQKKDQDMANMGSKAAAKALVAADAPKIDKDKVRSDAAKARHLAEGGQVKGEGKKKKDLSFLDDMIVPKKK
jgi:hypothetical protein